MDLKIFMSVIFFPLRELLTWRDTEGAYHNLLMAHEILYIFIIHFQSSRKNKKKKGRVVCIFMKEFRECHYQH